MGVYGQKEGFPDSHRVSRHPGFPDTHDRRRLHFPRVSRHPTSWLAISVSRSVSGFPSVSRWVSLRQESSRKEEVTRTQKPFIATLRVNESRPAKLGQQPEASLAWGGATLTAKRRQRVPMPCYRAPKYSSSGASVVDTCGGRADTP